MQPWECCLHDPIKMMYRPGDVTDMLSMLTGQSRASELTTWNMPLILIASSITLGLLDVSACCGLPMGCLSTVILLSGKMLHELHKAKAVANSYTESNGTTILWLTSALFKALLRPCPAKCKGIFGEHQQHAQDPTLAGNLLTLSNGITTLAVLQKVPCILCIHSCLGCNTCEHLEWLMLWLLMKSRRDKSIPW